MFIVKLQLIPDLFCLSYYRTAHWLFLLFLEFIFDFEFFLDQGHSRLSYCLTYDRSRTFWIVLFLAPKNPVNFRLFLLSWKMIKIIVTVAVWNVLTMFLVLVCVWAMWRQQRVCACMCACVSSHEVSHPALNELSVCIRWWRVKKKAGISRSWRWRNEIVRVKKNKKRKEEEPKGVEREREREREEWD